MTAPKPHVLFACIHNAGRSQMAGGWMRHLAGDRVEVSTGGSEPAEAVNPAAVAAMSEVGIDISDHVPRHWTDDGVRSADVVVTMDCGDECPVYPGNRYLDWKVEDPAGRELDAVRVIRDDLRAEVENLMEELGIEPQNS